MDAFGVSVKTHQPQGEMVEIPGFAAWASLDVKGQPGQVLLEITVQEQKGIVPFAIFESSPHTMEGGVGFNLTVPVRWQQKNRPFTRQKGLDNVDVILFDPRTKHFHDIQVGVVVRERSFYITAQKVWEGWIAGPSVDDLKFIPSDPADAYPGADYESIWRGMSRVHRTIWTFLEETPDDQVVKPAQWNPPALPQKEGWETGTVLFFNMVTGTGRVGSPDSPQGCFVHFSAIQAEGPMKVLRPMAGVYYQLGDPGKIAACIPA